MRPFFWCVLLLAALLSTGGQNLSGDEASPKFMSKDLPGWEGLISDYWTYKDGVLTGSTPKGLKFNTFLCSKAKYKDFELKFQVKLNKAGNSGVQIRSEIFDKDKFAVKGP